MRKINRYICVNKMTPAGLDDLCLGAPARVFQFLSGRVFFCWQVLVVLATYIGKTHGMHPNFQYDGFMPPFLY